MHGRSRLMEERTSFSPWWLLFLQEFGCYLLIFPSPLISQLILVPCKAHRLHSLLVVIPWQKCQAIWSPQHQHQHLMDRWHLCRVAGMKRSLLHFFVGLKFYNSLSQPFPFPAAQELIWFCGELVRASKASENDLVLEGREWKGGRSRRCISFLNTREGSDKHQCKVGHVNLWRAERKVEPRSTNLEPQPSFPCLPCPLLVYRFRHSCSGRRNVWF